MKNPVQPKLNGVYAGALPDGRKQKDRASSRQLQGVLQRPLLEAGALAKPGAI